jgi:hypothetical protein
VGDLGVAAGAVADTAAAGASVAGAAPAIGPRPAVVAAAPTLDTTEGSTMVQPDPVSAAI